MTTSQKPPLNKHTNILDIRHVTCQYLADQPAVQDISLAAQEGEIICILGPSGCGKTTTLRAIAGFEKVTGGEIYLDGHLVSSATTHVPTERRRVGMVFQDYALFPHLTVKDNVAFGLQRLSGAERHNCTTTMLQLVGLIGFESRYPHELSGGQQQRVALARALAPNPVILLLDEPFSNLDPDMTIKMRNELHRVLRQTNTTAVLVTHDHQEAFAMADRVAVLQDGLLVQYETPETIYHLPACRFVAEFVGKADFIPGFIQNGIVKTEIGQFPNHSHYQGVPNVLVMVRPDDIKIARISSGTARIVSRQFRGSQHLYSIELASGHIVHCVEPSDHAYTIDSKVTLEVIATHTVLFEDTTASTC
ncbi:MAG: ABC transporter ATP-binding protein [Nitrospirales bacterium]|nr:ABC transporter ATP-binding protein [Nitrospira sp.]MDR4500330.1 ABC transporter ATP-binding protein [Nitrospirales bacterium]